MNNEKALIALQRGDLSVLQLLQYMCHTAVGFMSMAQTHAEPSQRTCQRDSSNLFEVTSCVFLLRILKVLKLSAGAMRASASLPAELKEELVDVRRRRRALHKEAAKQAKSREREGVKSKFFSTLVLLCSGGAAYVVADVQGRLKRRGLSTCCIVSQEHLVADVQAMYDALPVSQLAALDCSWAGH